MFPNFFIDLLLLQICFKFFLKKLELNLLKTGRVFLLNSIHLDHSFKEQVEVKFYCLDSDGFPTTTYNQSPMRKQAMNQEFLAGLTLVNTGEKNKALKMLLAKCST